VGDDLKKNVFIILFDQTMVKFQIYFTLLDVITILLINYIFIFYNDVFEIGPISLVSDCNFFYSSLFMNYSFVYLDILLIHLNKISIYLKTKEVFNFKIQNQCLKW